MIGVLITSCNNKEYRDAGFGSVSVMPLSQINGSPLLTAGSLGFKVRSER